MTSGISRRHLLQHGGTAAAGLAGLGLIAGCGSAKATSRSSSSARSKGHPATSASPGVYHFVTRPDLEPPMVAITGRDRGVGSDYIFLGTVQSGPGHGGAMIVDTSGRLVWFDQDAGKVTKMNFRPQMFGGKQVLTWWQGAVVQGRGKGVAVIADSSYRTTHIIKAGNGLQADLHEFYLTPQNTALISAYRQYNVDLTPVGGPKNGVLVSGVAQEIDVATGKVLFEWDSMDHVALTETYNTYLAKKPGMGQGGTLVNPFDYFHINSISPMPDGDLLISARNTWALYKVSRKTGKVIWRMNGKKSDFAMGPGTHYYWQHHSRAHGPDKITVFDDGGDPAEEKQSRGLILKVDTAAMKVTLDHAYIHPGKTLLAGAMGSVEIMPSGNVFVGWGTETYFSEFAPDGTLLLDGQMTAKDPSYRAFKNTWTGHPTEPPAIAARSRGAEATVYASWNGATATRSWNVLAGSSRYSLAKVGAAAWSGFETAIPVSNAGPYFSVQALDGSGHVLAKSATVRVL